MRVWERRRHEGTRESWATPSEAPLRTLLGPLWRLVVALEVSVGLAEVG